MSARTPKDIEKVEKNFSGTIASVFLSVLFIAISSLMLFLQDMKLMYFCYAAAVLFVVWGVFLIGRYFLYGLYRTVNNYDFSLGVLIIVFGGFILVKGQDIVTSVTTFFGALMLISSVIMLQNAVQLKTMKGSMWLTDLIIAIVSIAGSVLVLLDINKIVSKNMIIMYISMLAIGILGLLSLLFVIVRTKSYKKEEDKVFKRNMEAINDFVDDDIAISVKDAPKAIEDGDASLSEYKEVEE